MTKMNMVWVAVATLIYPRTDSDVIVTKLDIDSEVERQFGVKITPVMINKHLVNSEDRQADRGNPARGGSRKRYLVRPRSGGFRLFKSKDSNADAWDKTGPTRPDISEINDEFAYLIKWYENEYINS